MELPVRLKACVTYDIVEMTATKMVLDKRYDWGHWKFTLKAK